MWGSLWRTESERWLLSVSLCKSGNIGCEAEQWQWRCKCRGIRELFYEGTLARFLGCLRENKSQGQMIFRWEQTRLTPKPCLAPPSVGFLSLQCLQFGQVRSAYSTTCRTIGKPHWVYLGKIFLSGGDGEAMGVWSDGIDDHESNKP